MVDQENCFDNNIQLRRTDLSTALLSEPFLESDQGTDSNNHVTNYIRSNFNTKFFIEWSKYFFPNFYWNKINFSFLSPQQEKKIKNIEKEKEKKILFVLD